MKNDKKSMIVTAVAVITLVAVVIGASFAYFAASIDDGAQTGVDVQTGTVDSFVLTTGDPISIVATQQNFATGAGNQSDTTTATASLKASNTSTGSTYYYYVYLDITNNEYIYTTEDMKPEIILTVTDQDNNPITELEGLSYVTVGDVSGFDITEYERLIPIISNREITTTTEIEETWNITVTFVNLETDQQENSGKTFNGNIIIQQEEIVRTYLSDQIISTYGTDTTLLLHDENLENSANDGSYRYSGGDYKVADAYSSEYTSVYDTASTTDVGVIKFYCSRGEDYSYVGASCSSSYTQYYFFSI